MIGSKNTGYVYHSLALQTITGRIGPGKKPATGIPWGGAEKNG
jgi:hypothetical protein